MCQQNSSMFFGYNNVFNINFHYCFNICIIIKGDGVNLIIQYTDQLANKTGGAIQENASDIGSTITKETKYVVEIDKKLQDLSK